MGSKVVLIHNVSAGALKPHFESTKSCLFVFFWKIERGPLLGEQRGFIFPHGFRSCRDDRSKQELEGREFCKDNDMNAIDFSLVLNTLLMYMECVTFISYSS